MDSIGDYLVIGFFVISFLSSIFKKKKKANANSKGKNNSALAQEQVIIKKERAQNPFEEFVKSINDELTIAKEEVTRSEVDEYYEQAMHNSDDTGMTVQDVFQQSETTSLIQETVREEREEANTIKSYAESVKHTKAKHESKKAKDIKKSLLRTDSIRDFIIMNEILGKPKALQR